LAAAETFLDPDVETVTPRRTLHGIAGARQLLAKATGNDQFAVEQTEAEFQEVEDEIVARTYEIARWRESGESRTSATLPSAWRLTTRESSGSS
jgi:hypothetical protein